MRAHAAVTVPRGVQESTFALTLRRGIGQLSPRRWTGKARREGGRGHRGGVVRRVPSCSSDVRSAGSRATSRIGGKRSHFLGLAGPLVRTAPLTSRAGQAFLHAEHMVRLARRFERMHNYGRGREISPFMAGGRNRRGHCRRWRVGVGGLAVTTSQRYVHVRGVRCRGHRASGEPGRLFDKGQAGWRYGPWPAA